METSPGHGYYVTGTDTGVGKTHVSVALLHALRAQGRMVAGMKPVASGCIALAGGLRNDDAMALQAASNPVPEYRFVNPYALRAATAPQIAAHLDAVTVTLGPIRAAYEQLRASADSVVVEGVGGWMAPLADGLDQARLANALSLPVILVVGMKLGCLSHARLSERAIRDDGLVLAGWVGSAVTADLEFASDYGQLLEREMQSPCLGMLPHAPGAPAASFAAFLRLPDQAGGTSGMVGSASSKLY